MGKVIDGVKTANSVARTGILIMLLAAFSYGGYLAYTNYIEPGLQVKEAKAQLAAATQQLSDLSARFDAQAVELQAQQAKAAELARQNEQLALANKLLKVDHRLARLQILEKGTDPETGEKFILVEFTEINDAGLRMGQPKQFRLKGEKLYLDAFVVKFSDAHIEVGDALRATSLYLFKRIFGDGDGLTGGHPLDVDSQGVIRAAAYVSNSETSSFEREIWSRFWEIANDPAQQRGLGVRNMHGQINYIDPQLGQVYECTLRSSDGLSFTLVSE